MIKINVNLLEKQNIELKGEENADFFDLEKNSQVKISSPFRYKLHAALVSGSVLLRGEFSYRISGICGRCLKNVEQEISENALAMYFDLPPTDELDVTGDLREEALLLLPINLLCSDDCAGLCAQCGADLNLKSCSCRPQDNVPASESPWSALDKF